MRPLKKNPPSAREGTAKELTFTEMAAKDKGCIADVSEKRKQGDVSGGTSTEAMQKAM